MSPSLLPSLRAAIARRVAPAGIDDPYLRIMPPMWARTAVDHEQTDGRIVSFADVYRTQPTVGAAINKLTRQASSLPLKVYRRGADNERERVIDHPLADLLGRPAYRSGAVHLKQWIFMPLLVHGNALLVKFRDAPDAPPTALLPLDWSMVEAWAPPGSPIRVWATTQLGDRRFVEVNETVHVAWQSPGTEIGTSPLEQLGVTIRAEDAAQRYSEANFRNSARPPSAITATEAFLGLDQSERQQLLSQLREDLTALYVGPENSGRPALLPPGLDWKPIGHTAQEAQLVEQRYVTWEQIGMVFDLPGPLLGDLRHGTYSNTSELNKQLYKTVLRPWLTLVEETLQAQLIDTEPAWRDERLFVEFDLAEQLKGDPVELATAIKTQIDAGVMTRNEARRLLNLPKVDVADADKLFYPANNQLPLGQTAPNGPVEPPQLP